MFSTIYNKYLKGGERRGRALEPDDRKAGSGGKEKDFKLKIIKEIELLEKYDREVSEKYNKYHFPLCMNMLVEGTPDKLCPRKLLPNKRTK
jgi:hypothetical protein